MQIDFIGPPVAGHLFETARTRFAAAGHAVPWATDHAAYLAGGGIAEADVVVAFGPFRIGAGELDRAARLRALVSPVTGTEMFDEAAASARTILVANGQVPENYNSMAEATVMLILATLYDLEASQRVLRENAPRPKELRGRMLMGKTVGLIGFGQIARGVAGRLAGWGCRIVTMVRTPRPLPAGVAAVSLEELLRESDVVVVLVPLNADSAGLLDAARLRTMRPEAAFINVARGGIVDEEALAALARERPGMRLALDTFAQEPLPSDSPLRTLPNAILTPRMVGHTRETHDRLPVALIENVERVLAGTVPEYVRNPEIVDAWLARWGTPTAVGA